MSAPNLMRVGTAENVFVEMQDYSGGDTQVTIRVKSHPTPETQYTFTMVTLNRNNNFQALGRLTVNQRLDH